MGLVVHTVYQEYHLFSKPIDEKFENLYMLTYKLTKQTLQGIEEEEVELSVRRQKKDLTEGISKVYRTGKITEEGETQKIIRQDHNEIPEGIMGELEKELEEQVPEGIRNLLDL